MNAFLNFFDSVSKGAFDFKAIGDFFTSRFAEIGASPELAQFWSTIMNLLNPVMAILPFVLMALSAVELLFGKKTLPFQRFLLFTAMGYVVGVVYVSPIINNVLTLPNYVSGVVIAVVAGVLSKYLYFATLGVAAWYTVYFVSFTGFIGPLAGLTLSNGPIGFIAATVVTVLVFVFRKYIEMIGTSFLGGLFISKCFAWGIYDYTKIPSLGPNGYILGLVAIGILGIVGSIFQIKHRKRY